AIFEARARSAGGDGEGDGRGPGGGGLVADVERDHGEHLARRGAGDEVDAGGDVPAAAGARDLAARVGPGGQDDLDAVHAGAGAGPGGAGLGTSWGGGGRGGGDR